MQHNLAYVDYHQLHPPSNHQGNRPPQSLGCHFAYFDAQWAVAVGLANPPHFCKRVTSATMVTSLAKLRWMS